MVKNILWKCNLYNLILTEYGHVKDLNYKLMVEIKFDACYLIIRFWDFSLDFTERVTYVRYKMENKSAFMKNFVKWRILERKNS